MYPAMDFAPARRAYAAPVDFQIFPQREDPAKLQKPQRKYSCVGNDRPKLSVREASGGKKRAGARAEEDFVLDDVSDAGENRLVKQHVRDF